MMVAPATVSRALSLLIVFWSAVAWSWSLLASLGTALVFSFSAVAAVVFGSTRASVTGLSVERVVGQPRA